MVVSVCLVCSEGRLSRCCVQLLLLDDMIGEVVCHEELVITSKMVGGDSLDISASIVIVADCLDTFIHLTVNSRDASRLLAFASFFHDGIVVCVLWVRIRQACHSQGGIAQKIIVVVICSLMECR